MTTASASDGLGPLIYDFAQVVRCEAALLCRAIDDRVHVLGSWGINKPLGVTVTRPGGLGRGGGAPPETGGSFVGRALTHGRLAAEALDPVRDADLIEAADMTLSQALAIPVPAPDDEGATLIAGFVSPRPAQLEPAIWLAHCYATAFALWLLVPDSRHMCDPSRPTESDAAANLPSAARTSLL